MTKRGAFNNNYFTFIVFAAPFMAMVLHNAIKLSPKWLTTVLQFAVAVQLLLLFYNPLTVIPTASDFQAGQKMLSYIDSVSGEVYVPNHTYYGYMAKGKMHVSRTSMKDMTSGGEPLPEAFVDKIVNRKYSAIIADQDLMWPFKEIRPDYLLKDLIVENYELKELLFPFSDKELFFPVVGYKTRPVFVFVPKK